MLRSTFWCWMGILDRSVGSVKQCTFWTDCSGESSLMMGGGSSASMSAASSDFKSNLSEEELAELAETMKAKNKESIEFLEQKLQEAIEGTNFSPQTSSSGPTPPGGGSGGSQSSTNSLDVETRFYRVARMGRGGLRGWLGRRVGQYPSRFGQCFAIFDQEKLPRSYMTTDFLGLRQSARVFRVFHDRNHINTASSFPRSPSLNQAGGDC